MKRKLISCAFFAGLLSLSGVAQASTFTESEPNDSIATPQVLDIGDGSGTVTAAMDSSTDIDFYTFYGQQGDVVTIDIDGAAPGFDSIVYLFDPTGAVEAWNDDAGAYPADPTTCLDPGSNACSDSRIDQWKLLSTGMYVVGVSSYPHFMSDGGAVSNSTMAGGVGTYTLIISGVSAPPVASDPPVDPLQISILVRPHDRSLMRNDSRARRMIPVALLSDSDFNAVTVDQSSLTFGVTGDEPSLARCLYPQDVNHDGMLDLVCDFKNQVAGFEPGDLEAIVHGKTDDGREFMGKGMLKAWPEKHRHGYRHRHHHHHHGHDRRHHDRDHDHDD